jgi:hypothetical protein
LRIENEELRMKQQWWFSQFSILNFQFTWSAVYANRHCRPANSQCAA